MTQWFAAAWHVCSTKNGASALGLQKLLGLGSYETAWAWLHKLRRAMVRPDRDRLSGTVEVDETMVGGVSPGMFGAATGKVPPANPADPDVDIWEAVVWATVSGTAIGVARMLAGRRAANYYARSTGHLPPELQSDAYKEARAAAAVAQEEAAAAAEAVGKKGRRARRKAGV